VSVAYNLGLVGRVFLEGGDGFLSASFLRNSDNGIEDENGENLETMAVSACTRLSGGKSTYNSGIYESGPSFFFLEKGEYKGYCSRS
jgi:hypothetical protein